MDCHEFLLRYSDYDDSLIPAHETDRFRAHMAVCAACARYDRVLRKGRMLARQLPRLEPGRDLIPRLRLRLLPPPSRRGSPAPRLTAGLAAATVLMVVASAAWLLDATPGPAFMMPGPGDGASSAETAAGETAARSAPAVRAPRLAMLPPLAAGRAGAARAWTAAEVAPADTARYSPLVTGPPAYRPRLPSPPGTTHSDRRALD